MKVAGSHAARASTFSSSLGVNLRGSTGRSIDVWLQKHKKPQGNPPAPATPRDEPPLSSQRRQAHALKGNAQELEAVVALKSKQVCSSVASVAAAIGRAN